MPKYDLKIISSMFDEDFYVEPRPDFDESELDDVKRLMIACKNCGELRPRDDKYIQRNGKCYLCSIDAKHERARRREREISR